MQLTTVPVARRQRHDASRNKAFPTTTPLTRRAYRRPQLHRPFQQLISPVRHLVRFPAPRTAVIQHTMDSMHHNHWGNIIVTTRQYKQVHQWRHNWPLRHCWQRLNWARARLRKTRMAIQPMTGWRFDETRQKQHVSLGSLSPYLS